MARHYSTRTFFRQIPNNLLARYFEDRGLFGDLDFSVMEGLAAFPRSTLPYHGHA